VGFLGLAALFVLLAHRNNLADSSSRASTDQSTAKAPANDKRQPPPERDKKPQPPADNPQPLAKKDKEAISPAPPGKKDKEEKPPAPAPGGADLPKEVKNSIGMKLMLISAGKFTMGSSPAEPFATVSEGFETQHPVEITQPFYLGKYLVTQAEYRRVMKDNPSWFSAKGFDKDKVAGIDTDNFPVDNISWEMAKKFCDTLSELPDEKAAKRTYRLPTEAEWEYACREAGRSSTPFCFGKSLSSTQANFDGNYPYGGAAKGPNLQRTTPVDNYQPNKLGLYDMHGNLQQWCQDWYDKDYYKKSPPKDPQGPEHGDRRVLRGGSWNSRGWECRAGYRDRKPPGYCINFGFRLVLVAGTRTP
jgi:formylglycine-generating enzyme required for sulfatase activity